MLAAISTAKAIELCAALAGVAPPSTPTSSIAVSSGARLAGQPTNLADAEATVRDLLAVGADFSAGPLAIEGRDFPLYGVTPITVFDPCAADTGEDDSDGLDTHPSPTIASVTALLRRSFNARITDTARPLTATYGARNSWHKVGQAIDFVPLGGVGAIDRAQIRTLMTAHGVRLIELLGPGDRGHADHWHVAFAGPGQALDRARRPTQDEPWLLDAASASQLPASGSGAFNASPAARETAATAPAGRDVFAIAAWRVRRGAGS